MDALRLVPVARGLSDFEAKVLTARLGSEGIIWQTRGVVDSVYPFGAIDVLVPADEADEARNVLESSADPAFDDGELDEDEVHRDTGGHRWWYTAVVVTAVVIFFVLRLMSLAFASPRLDSRNCTVPGEALVAGATATCHP